MDEEVRQDVAATRRHRLSMGLDRAGRVQDERPEHGRLLAYAIRPVPPRRTLERTGGVAISGIRKQDGRARHTRSMRIHDGDGNANGNRVALMQGCARSMMIKLEGDV
ncbi:hypothetical protein EMIT0111MI5_250024 [Burkholderia sp. IT-111MI5]